MGIAAYKVFISGDRIVLTAAHLINKGQAGYVLRWVHGDWYHAVLDSGKEVVVRAAEIEAEDTA